MKKNNKHNSVIKAKYSSFDEFKNKFNLLESENTEIPNELKKDFEELAKNFIKRIEMVYKDGDELWHYDNFHNAPNQCGREYILLVRNNKIIDNFLIKMS